MGDKNDAPKAPDLSPLYNAQKGLADDATSHANEQLQWARDQFAKNSGTSDDFINNALHSQDALNGNAATDRHTYDNVFTPELQAQKDEADNYASGSRKDQAMGAAQAGVAQNFDAARNAATQNLESYGVNPASTRFAALDIGTRAQQAAAAAAAGTQASNDVDTKAQALRQQVIQNSSPLAAQSTNESTAATNTGAAAVNAGNSTTQTGAATMGTAPQYDQIAGSDLTGAANTQNAGYQNQLNQYKADQSSSSGWGTLAGAAIGVGGAMMGMPTTSVGGKLLGFADGGAIPSDASPSNGAVTDDVPAVGPGKQAIKLNANEFVIPQDVMLWKGQEYFQKEISKARQQRQQGTVARPQMKPAAPQGAIPTGA